MRRWLARSLAGLLLLVAAGCAERLALPSAPSGADSPTASPLAAAEPSQPASPTAPLPAETQTPAPPAAITPAPPAAPTPTEAAAATLAAPATSAPPEPPAAPRPGYHLEADMDAIAHTVLVTAAVSLAPPGDAELVFNVNALRMPGTFHLLDLQVNGAAATYYTGGVWLHVPLPAEAAGSQRLTVQFVYQLILPLIPSEAWGWQGTLGWSGYQINLGDWYPVLAVHTPELGWVTPAPGETGEYHTAEAADYDVALRIRGFTYEPMVMGSGEPVTCAGRCFTLSGGRFVAYVISDHMASQSLTASEGITVTSIYFPAHSLAGRAVLETALGALERYRQLYGPYPYPAFTVVEGDFIDGMEYSGLSFLGETFYVAYDGTPNNLLTAIGAHETAHQWWSALVGNDPAREPWLDEALSTYSELVYLEAAHPEVAPNWWNWRINGRHPVGAVNNPIYVFASFRPYVNAVYLRGAEMLHAMRQAVGDERFFAFVRQYARAQAGRVATGADFWQAYAAQGGDPAAIQAQYFAEP